MKKLTPLAKEGKINQEASIRDGQSTIILAPIEKVWAILTDISNWPSWNSDIKSARGESLEVNGSFRWELHGDNFESVIRMLRKPETLSWTATTTGLKAIHVWKLEETDGNRTIVTADVSLQGFRTVFYGHQKLHNTLLNWLESLKQRAEA